MTCTYTILINSAPTGKLVHQTTKNTSHLIILTIKRKKKGKGKGGPKSEPKKCEVRQRSIDVSIYDILASCININYINNCPPKLIWKMKWFPYSCKIRTITGHENQQKCEKSTFGSIRNKDNEGVHLLKTFDAWIPALEEDEPCMWCCKGLGILNLNFFVSNWFKYLEVSYTTVWAELIVSAVVIIF